MMRNTAPTTAKTGAKSSPPKTISAPSAINAIAPIHERMQMIVTPKGLSAIFLTTPSFEKFQLVTTSVFSYKKYSVT